MAKKAELAAISAKDKTFEQKVKAIFINFSAEELIKFSVALHVLDEHEDLNERSIDELWLEITTIIEGRK